LVYENVSRLCKKRNWTIQKLEQKAGLKNGTIGKWRESTPRSDLLRAVAKVLHVSMESLMRDEPTDE